MVKGPIRNLEALFFFFFSLRGEMRGQQRQEKKRKTDLQEEQIRGTGTLVHMFWRHFAKEKQRAKMCDRS